MLNLNSIMLGSSQPKVMAEFYENVFGKKPDMVEGDWNGWQVGSCFFGVGRHSKMSSAAADPGRIMFNLETTDIVSNFERIKKLGAKIVKEVYDMGSSKICTFADPDGNYFQLMTPWKS